MDNNELLQAILDKQDLIYRELRDRRDEGGALYPQGTVLTTDFTIIDTKKAPSHPVKAYMIRNTGTNNLYVAHNLAKPIYTVDLIDTTKPNPIFNILVPNEPEDITYDVNCIEAIYLLAIGGSTTFKMKLLW